MEVDRRSLIVGGVAVAATAAIPAVALAAVPPTGPLSPVFSPAIDMLLSAHMYENGKVGLTLLRSDPEDLTPVASVEEAEDQYLLDLIDIRESNTLRLSGNDREADAQALSIAITRRATRIALSTRRSCGNRVFAHPRTFERLHPIAWIAEKQRIGAWREYSWANTSIALWANPRLPADRLFVAYVSDNELSMDGPAGLAYKDGQLMMLKRRRRLNFVADATDYGATIRIVDRVSAVS